MTDPRPPRPAPLRSARDGMHPEERAPVESATREVEIAGTTWTVSAEGKARVKAGGGSAAPLVLVVFRAEGEEALEALVVGRRLDELPADRLVDAFRSARPHRPDPEAAPFFDGTRPREPHR